ncbi:MAG: MipA/OmpV family protein [Bdellovibrionales bacterium]
MLELGVGIFGAWFPQYPASRDNQYLVLPTPLARLRTPYVKADREDGLRSLLFDGDNYTTTFSFSGSFPAGSKNNEDREGMPPLDLLIEFGPKVIYHLHNSDQLGQIEIHLPIRAVSSASFTFQEEQGFTFSPFISWKHLNFMNWGHEFYLYSGATWATKKLHRYFYEVSSEFSTIDRSQYSAKEGYLGSYITLAYVIPVGIHNFYSYVGVDRHTGAANSNSPLFINEMNYSVGLGMSWNLWQSPNLIKVNQRF